MPLNLTRKEGEVICIGDDVRIQVMSARGGVAKISCIGPRTVRIDREEVRHSRDHGTTGRRDDGKTGPQ